MILAIAIPQPYVAMHVTANMTPRSSRFRRARRIGWTNGSSPYARAQSARDSALGDRRTRNNIATVGIWRVASWNITICAPTLVVMGS